MTANRKPRYSMKRMRRRAGMAFRPIRFFRFRRLPRNSKDYFMADTLDYVCPLDMEDMADALLETDGLMDRLLKARALDAGSYSVLDFRMKALWLWALSRLNAQRVDHARSGIVATRLRARGVMLGGIAKERASHLGEKHTARLESAANRSAVKPTEKLTVADLVSRKVDGR